MMKPTKDNLENVIFSIIEARENLNKLTAEEIVKNFPHAVRSFKYVNGELKITLHSLPS